MTSLCQLAGDYRGTSLPAHGSMAEPKIDGFRCLYFPDYKGRPTLWSRNGIQLRGAGHILQRLERIEAAAGQRLMIDGEAQVGGTLAATKAHFERGWKSGDAGHFHAFDCVPLANWRAERCGTPLYQRKAMLAEAIAATDSDPILSWEWEAGSRGRDHGKPCVTLMPERWVADLSDLRAYADEIWAAGGEGLMLKDAESPYQRKRSGDWLKIKSPGQFSPSAN